MGNNRQGFTLIELLVVIAILGILLAYVTFPRKEGVETNRLANDAVNLLQRGRYEAIKQNGYTFIRINSDSLELYLDSNADGALQTDTDRRLERLATSSYQTPLTLDSNYPSGILRWNPRGLPEKESGALGAGRITIQAKNIAKSICISAAGRIRIADGGSCS